MIARATPQAFALAALLGWLLFLAVLVDRAELLVAAVPLAIAFLSVARQRGLPRFSLGNSVAETRLAEGDRTTVTVRLAAGDPLPMTEILSVLAPPLRLAAGNNRTVQGVEPGGEASWSFAVQCPDRGRFDLGETLLRFWDRSGLCVTETRLAHPAAVAVYPAVQRLRHVPQPRRTQSSFGNYVSARVGEGIEPGELRPFAPGDRIRHINWRATARRRELYVTRFQEERNADVVLLLDTLSDCGTPPHSTLDQGVRAAASLAQAYLARKDRVGFLEFGGYLRWIGPGTGRRQAEALIEALLPSATHFSYVAPRLDRLPPRVLPPRALVLALSPLLDKRFADALADLTARRFDVIVVATSPAEATRRSLAPTAADDLACRLWTLEWQAALDRLRQKGILIVEWDGIAPLEAVLAPLARTRLRSAVRS
jgi:uncharacterized protein (DUF58 family)